MKKIIVSVCFILSLVSLVSCDPLEKQKKYCDGNTSLKFTFKLPYTIFPCKDTFKVGDTLWIESTFSNQMYNEDNGKTYTVDNLKFGLSGAINDLSTDPMIGTSNFTLLDKGGNVDNNNKSGVYFNVAYAYSNDTGYYWKCGIVLKKQGGGYITFFSPIVGDPLSKTGQHITQCKTEWVIPIMKRDNCDAHYYLIKDAADPYVKETSEHLTTNTFLFYVKE